MKLLHLTAAISAALISVPNTCLSQTVVNGVKYPVASRTRLPNCYIETSDRRIFDLTSICGEPEEAADAGGQVATPKTQLSAPDRAVVKDDRESRLCNNQNTESAQTCQDWAANKLPGTPY